MTKVKSLRRYKIKKRIRKRITGTPERPRLSVFRSNTSITAQFIDDVKQVTLGEVSSRSFSDKKNCNIDIAKQVGTKAAAKASELGIETVVFDRNGYLYHGKVKAVAEGAREGGLKF